MISTVGKLELLKDIRKTNKKQVKNYQITTNKNCSSLLSFNWFLEEKLNKQKTENLKISYLDIKQKGKSDL